MDETFSSIDLVTQCLLDSERTSLFEKVINNVVKPGQRVLDAGTGSGILSLFAARAGAKKVLSVEYDPYVAELAKKNITRNGFGDVVDVVLGDVRNLDLNENTAFDVVIMEMLTTGMVDEYQIWSVNNLFKKGYANDKTIFIPCKQETFVSLVNSDFNNHDLDMRMVKHLWSFLPKQEISFMSNEEILNSHSFNKEIELSFNFNKVFSINKVGVINSIYLRSLTWLSEEVSVGDTLALNAPVIYPLENDINVSSGDKIELSIKYDFGNGYRNFQVNANKF